MTVGPTLERGDLRSRPRRPARAARLVPWCAMLLLSTLAACTRAPREVVVLADVTSEQMANLQASHVGFVRLYYDQLRARVDDFVMDRWLPAFLDSTLAGETESSRRLLGDLRDSWPLLDLDPEQLEVSLQGGQQLRPQEREAVLARLRQSLRGSRGAFGEVMVDYALAVEEQLERRRRSLLRPIDDQERAVLREIEMAYTELREARAELRAYLASVVELRAEQDVMLRKLGLLEARDAWMTALEKGSERIARALEASESIDEALERFRSTLAELEAELDRALER